MAEPVNYRNKPFDTWNLIHDGGGIFRISRESGEFVAAYYNFGGRQQSWDQSWTKTELVAHTETI